MDAVFLFLLFSRRWQILIYVYYAMPGRCLCAISQQKKKKKKWVHSIEVRVYLNAIILTRSRCQWKGVKVAYYTPTSNYKLISIFIVSAI